MKSCSFSSSVRLIGEDCVLLGYDLRHMPEGGGVVVAQLVEALHYKPEGRGLDSEMCHWNFSLT
jgi:hypothetical protein